jgi:hypothetical protein
MYYGKMSGLFIQRYSLLRSIAPKILLISWLLLASPLHGQSNAQLDTLNDHLLGNWKGVNHDYSKNPTITSEVSIVIVRDKKPDQLKMYYSYVEDLTKKTTHYTFLIHFDPKKSTLFRDRGKNGGKYIYDVDGLDEVLRTGYGDFKLKGIVMDRDRKKRPYQADYHLTSQTFSYEAYIGGDDTPVVKTGDWSLSRENANP